MTPKFAICRHGDLYDTFATLDSAIKSAKTEVETSGDNNDEMYVLQVVKLVKLPPGDAIVEDVK